MTQEDSILEALKRGEKITPLEALKYHNCMRLGARIFDLKQKGHDIKTKMVHGENGKIYASYYLDNMKELGLFGEEVEMNYKKPKHGKFKDNKNEALPRDETLWLASYRDSLK